MLISTICFALLCSCANENPIQDNSTYCSTGELTDMNVQYTASHTFDTAEGTLYEEGQYYKIFVSVNFHSG